MPAGRSGKDFDADESSGGGEKVLWCDKTPVRQADLEDARMLHHRGIAAEIFLRKCFREVQEEASAPACEESEQATIRNRSS
jgi:hypothetical protein